LARHQYDAVFTGMDGCLSSLQKLYVTTFTLGSARGFFSLVRDGSLLGDIQASLQRVLVGFLIASMIGAPLGIFLAYFYIPRQILLPIITLLRPIPPIAWIPLAILWFGIGNSSSYFITAIAAFFRFSLTLSQVEEQLIGIISMPQMLGGKASGFVY
jgi:ABC-type nitrate/sulfonate/bicarbonate transport system permease component